MKPEFVKKFFGVGVVEGFEGFFRFSKTLRSLFCLLQNFARLVSVKFSLVGDCQTLRSLFCLLQNFARLVSVKFSLVGKI